jgi:hypothetical protein
MPPSVNPAPRQPPSPRQPPRLTTGCLSIVFTWQGDRWLHRILLADEVLLESVEGPCPDDGDPRWPASPVLTEVSSVETATGPALLGVGLAGRSHFSASITADRLRPDTLVFEIACRIHEQPVWLGSTYTVPGELAAAPRIAASTDPSGPLPRTVAWTYAIGPGGLLLPMAAPDRPPAGT